MRERERERGRERMRERERGRERMRENEREREHERERENHNNTLITSISGEINTSRKLARHQAKLSVNCQFHGYKKTLCYLWGWCHQKCITKWLPHR